MSGNGSITENLSRFVAQHAKPLVSKISAYIEDTPDFLRILRDKNNSNTIKDTDILVTLDVSSLYTNIKQEDGIASMQRALDSRSDPTIPTDFLIKLLQLVLTCNVFEFGKHLFLQMCGTAMGTACAPNYATLAMHSIDVLIKKLAKDLSDGLNPIQLYKRFLDDLFLIYRGSIENLEHFLSEINNLHPTIKFTSSFTCPFPCTFPPGVTHDCFCYSSRSIPFLDTLVTIKNNTLVTDVYKKPTNCNQILLPSSCHPAHIPNNIPLSICFRFVRICSFKHILKIRLDEMKEDLLARGYNKKILDGAITKALDMDRDEALEKREKKSSDRIPFVITYHPALPSISTILRQGWKVMTKDEHLKKVFPQPPMVAYRQPKNSSLRQLLVKSKLPEREKRVVKGMKKCNQQSCNTCPLVRETKTVYSSTNNYSVEINAPVTCETKNIIYVITCNKKECKNIQYIGESGKKLKQRFAQHLACVRSTNEDQKPTATGEHFNMPGHSINNMKVSILEKVTQDSIAYRKIRESFYINKFETKHCGLNRKM